MELQSANPSYFTKRIDELKKALVERCRNSKTLCRRKERHIRTCGRILHSPSTRQQGRPPCKNFGKHCAGDHTTLGREFAGLVGTVVRPALKEMGYQDLVIVIDWLEKLVDTPVDGSPQLGGHRALFLHHAQAFKSWDAQVVLTIPIDLVYSVDQENLLPGLRLRTYCDKRNRRRGLCR